MIRELKILQQHGVQYVPDIRKAVIPGIFRGRPEISIEIKTGEVEELVRICPVGAILPDHGLSIDLGRCVFCKECEFQFPEKIHFTTDHKITTNVRERLIVKAGEKGGISLDQSTIRSEIRKTFKGSLKLRQVSAGGDGSNEMELNACGNVNFDMGRFGIDFVASPRHADGIVVTGPITENMAEALRITWEAVPSPKILILVGTDAISGGLFADSQALNRSFLNDHIPDLYVPGNPAHPLTFINGLLSLLEG